MARASRTGSRLATSPASGPRASAARSATRSASCRSIVITMTSSRVLRQQTPEAGRGPWLGGLFLPGIPVRGAGSALDGLRDLGALLLDALVERGGHLDGLVEEVALRLEQLEGEVVGGVDQLRGGGVAVGARPRGGLGHELLGRLGPAAQTVDDGLLALADGVEDLALQVVGGGLGGSQLAFLSVRCVSSVRCKLYLAQRWFVKCYPRGMNDLWKSQMEALGSFIRTQRKLAEMTEVSNPYLSQLERGLHQPSFRVLKAIADALNLSAETLLVQAGLLEGEGEEGDAGRARSSVESAIRTDPIRSEEQKEALINVYRAMAHDRRSG